MYAKEERKDASKYFPKCVLRSTRISTPSCVSDPAQVESCLVFDISFAASVVVSKPFHIVPLAERRSGSSLRLAMSMWSRNVYIRCLAKCNILFNIPSPQNPSISRPSPETYRHLFARASHRRKVVQQSYKICFEAIYRQAVRFLYFKGDAVGGGTYPMPKT